MANNYTNFSELLVLENKEQEDWVRAELANPTKNIPDGADGPAAFEAYLKNWVREHRRAYSDEAEPETWPDFDWSIESDGLWIRDNGENGNLQILSVFVQRFLKKFRPKDNWQVTWADTCSKSRIGEFGGGGMVVTAKRIKWFSINQEINKYLKGIGPRVKVTGKKTTKKGL
jgi:hypothetical protein